jgi:hypothetical protein
VKVFKPKEGKFKLQPKEGTKAYDKLIKKMWAYNKNDPYKVERVCQSG